MKHKKKVIKLVEDEPVLCRNCPYKRVGLTCYDKNQTSCLRTDMMQIDEAFWKHKYEKEKNSERNNL